MKIAMISGEFPPMPGGVGDFTRILTDKLRALGHEVVILSSLAAANAISPVSHVGGWGLWSLCRIRAWLRCAAPDIVNLQFQTAAYDMSPFIHFLPRIASAPVVTTFHDLRFPYLFPKAGPLRDWIVLHLARSSAGVISANHADDMRLSALSKRRLIPIGSSIPRAALSRPERAALRQSMGADDGTFLLGHFGFVNAIKGARHIVEALAQLRQAGQDARLVFIGGRGNTVDGGEDTRYLRDLDALIQQLGLAHAVRWTGFLPDVAVAARMNAIDLMVLPFTDGAAYSRSSLIAAIHQGCAILTTEPAVDIEAFCHKRNLWLVPRKSAESLQIAVARLMSNREQLKTLRAGAAELSKAFDWDAIARETADFYQACL